MENNHSYFNGIIRGVKSLAIGLGVTFKEYVTPKSIDQILTLEWKYLMPFALFNLVLMTLCVALGIHG